MLFCRLNVSGLCVYLYLRFFCRICGCFFQLLKIIILIKIKWPNNTKNKKTTTTKKQKTVKAYSVYKISQTVVPIGPSSENKFTS